jgi:hypothetical protein
LEADLGTARRHIVWLAELERLVTTSRAAIEQSLLDNLLRFGAPEREYDLAVALERAVRAAAQPARARLDVELQVVPDSSRKLAETVMNAAAPLQDAARTINDLRAIRSYTEETRAAARCGERLYESAVAEEFGRVQGHDHPVLDVVRRLALLRALRDAHQACVVAAAQCERFTLMST